jgi:peroxiredoxin
LRECCYRDGTWRPYCTIELEALGEHCAALGALGTTLVAFSPQTVTHNLKTVRDYDLGFNLLSDAVNAVYRPRGVELSQYNGAHSGECCCRRAMSSVSTTRP